MNKVFLQTSHHPRLVAFLIVLMGLFVTPAAAFAATLALSPASGTFNAGCTYAVQIILDTAGADTDGTDVILDYDQSKFTMSPPTNGILYPDYPISSVDTQNAKVSISGLASVAKAYNGKGVFATLNFTIPAAATAGATSLIFEFDPNNPGKTTDSNVVQRGTVSDLLNGVTNGNYTIGTGTCVNPSPSGGIGDFNATPSATPLITKPNLPKSGSADTTTMLTIVGSILTVLGIAGLALL